MMLLMSVPTCRYLCGLGTHQRETRSLPTSCILTITPRFSPKARPEGQRWQQRRGIHGGWTR